VLATDRDGASRTYLRSTAMEQTAAMVSILFWRAAIVARMIGHSIDEKAYAELEFSDKAAINSTGI
jgi:hypothetical protein